MSAGHIVTSFEDELKELDAIILDMGGLAELQLAEAMEAMVQRDAAMAERIAANDKRIDALESSVDDLVIRMLALRQPVADDLRLVITALRTSAVLERIGDYAKNVAKRTIAMSKATPPPKGSTQAVARMGGVVQGMVKDVLDAYTERDIAKASNVVERDEEVDAIHTSLFREMLTYMMEDSQNIASCAHLLFIAKNIERIGDHATNIAENVHFMAAGHKPEEKRTKGDASSYTVVDLDDALDDGGEEGGEGDDEEEE
jgi:phosphate transport system protein